MKKRAVPELRLLAQPVPEAPPVVPPASILGPLQTIASIFEKFDHVADSEYWYRVSEIARRKESAQKVAQRMNAAVKWLREHGELEREIEVRVRATLGEQTAHDQAQFQTRLPGASSPSKTGPWAVFVKLPSHGEYDAQQH